VEGVSKQYSWAWVTADQCLCHVECELLYAFITPSAAEAEVYIYDGENTNGDKIFKFVTASKNTRPFAPKVPVYCRRGLYVDIVKNTEGVFVQWRVL
jgi:hypothetical protein